MCRMMRQERMKRGWSCEYVAEQTGLTAEAIRLIETGKRNPSYHVLMKLLELFDYSDPRKLFGAATPKSTPGGNRGNKNISIQA